MLYAAIDNSNGYYINKIDPKYRSRINVLFSIGEHDGGYTDLEKKFFTEATAVGLQQLKGLPVYGGVRVSMYNAMPIEGVERLIDFMQTFQQNNPLEPQVTDL